MRPVVGWLVAIEGPAKGRDFRIFPEGNKIGRAESFDIHIADPTIGREEPHAIIFFNPRAVDAEQLKEAFVLRPGDRWGVWLNDAPVHGPASLHPYDQIQLGDTTLLFVPLCNEVFTWDFSAGTGKSGDPVE